MTDAKGVVRSRFFEKTYVERRTAASLLALAGETPEAPASETSTPTFTLRTWASNDAAAPGQRVTLVLDFEMKSGMHAYASGPHGYRALRLRLEPQALVTIHESAFPEAHPYHFAPLDETVPVFEGRFRLTQDVTLASGRDFAELLKTPNPALTIAGTAGVVAQINWNNAPGNNGTTASIDSPIAGTLEYQVCSDKVCLAPAALPLQWTIPVLPLDRERSPEAIRHKPGKT